MVSACSLTAASRCAHRNRPTLVPVSSSLARSADGASIAYDTRGSSGPIALVFVHGWLGDRTDWQNQAEYFARRSAKRYTVVTLDLAGHGESGHDRTGQSISSFGDDVKAVVEALDLQSIILIGHNLGGDAILEAARDLDDRVIGLIWIDTYRNLDLLNNAQKEQNGRFLDKLNKQFVSTARALGRRMLSANVEPQFADRVIGRIGDSERQDIAVESMKAALDYGFGVRDILKTVKFPIVAFTPWTPTWPEDCAAMRKAGVALRLMEGRAYMMLEKPDDLNGPLLEVIQHWTPDHLVLPVDFKKHGRPNTLDYCPTVPPRLP
jgi:pimeloyl-ACP methyl ester carboxylesterase